MMCTLTLVEGTHYTVNGYFPAEIVLGDEGYRVLYNGFDRPILSITDSADGSAAALRVSFRVTVAIKPSPAQRAAPA
jgi:hypothetical protein